MVLFAEASTCRLHRRGVFSLRRKTPSKLGSVPQSLVRGRGGDSSYSFLEIVLFTLEGNGGQKDVNSPKRGVQQAGA
jgi:hypothetical protein